MINRLKQRGVLPVSWIIHNYHLAHSNIHFDYCHAGHDSPLTDTHRQEKGGKKLRLKDGPGCSQWTAILERTWSLTGMLTFSADGEHTGVWWLCVSVVLMPWNQSVKGVMYDKDTNECTSKGEWLTCGFKYLRNMFYHTNDGIQMSAFIWVRHLSTMSRYLYFAWLFPFHLYVYWS